MAKRKRLTPAQPGYLDGAPEVKSALGTPMASASAPIAQVAGDSAARAALDELSDLMETARADGRLIERIALDHIDERHLVRDRLEQDEDEMTALMDSLRARGQQTAIEVTALSERPDQRSHGLISGWRRLTALRRLYAETSDPRFATVKALVIRPETAQDAYVAMVEENEIRVNLSHYERARIAVRALREGVFDSQRAALQGLFGSTTRSKRSKIGTFIALVEAFDAVLYFPSAISEKLGLAVARELTRDPGFEAAVKARLKANERTTAGGEMKLLAAAVMAAQEQALIRTAEPEPKPQEPATPPHGPAVSAGERLNTQVAPGIRMGYTPDRNRIELTGDAVDAALMQDLQDWLRSR